LCYLWTFLLPHAAHDEILLLKVIPLATLLVQIDVELYRMGPRPAFRAALPPRRIHRSQYRSQIVSAS